MTRNVTFSNYATSTLDVAVTVPSDPWVALRRIIEALGPEEAGCAKCCEGCRAEIASALAIARHAFGMNAEQEES